MKHALALTFALSLFGQTSPSPVSFSLSMNGTHHVTTGHYMIDTVQGTLISGTDQGATITVSNLPVGVSVTYPNILKFCCTTSTYNIGDTQTIRFEAASSTTPGTYHLVVNYTTPGGAASTPWDLIVDAQPAAITKMKPPPNVALTGLAQWETNMKTFGKIHCTPADFAFAANASIYYYDGVFVYYQIADYTKDTSWNACAQGVLGPFKKYNSDNTTVDIRGPHSRIPGYFVYAAGPAVDFQRTNDATSKIMVQSLAHGIYSDLAEPGNPNNPSYIVDWSASREAALAIRAQYQLVNVGLSPGANLQDLIEIMIGHFNQWFLDKSAAYNQSFMVALSAEAAIDYYNQSHDTRIPYLLKLAADNLMSQWDAASQSWVYNNGGTPNTFGPSPDLNLLIAPLYYWVFQQTGIQKYRDEGDAAFNSGVKNAYLGSAGAGGKQFSQNYHWNFSFLKWRENSVIAVTPCGPQLTITSTAVSWLAGSCPVK